MKGESALSRPLRTVAWLIAVRRPMPLRRRRPLVPAMLIMLMPGWACGTDAGPRGDSSDAGSEVAGDATSDASDGVGADGAADGTDGAAGDALAVDADAGGLPPLLVGPTVAEPPADPLAGSSLTSCPIYQQEVCEGGVLRRCAIYDVEAEQFVETPDALLHRVLLYDRWYDLYASPDGQTGERVFTQPMSPGTEESVWGDPANFSLFVGKGDSAMWSSVALLSYAFRYLVTGTQADYQRMEDKLRAHLLKFEVTGVDGYLARMHFLWYPETGPSSDQHFVQHGPAIAADSRNNPIEDPASIPGLPQAYEDGLPDAQGQLATGTPMWNGHPSIDQYTGPMVAYPVVYSLLRDEALKERITRHLTCYFKRLQRVEIINLDQNAQALEAITAYFGGSRLLLDPTDPDLTQLTRLVGYYNRGFNSANASTFDRSCPETVAMEPTLVIDAADESGFILGMLGLSARLDEDSSKPPAKDQIDHIYLPNVRGADASHMIHMAALSYWLTGEEQYRTFLFEELIGGLQANEVVQTMQAFRLPDPCNKFYPDHITYPTHWQLITLLRESPLRDEMVRAMEEEMWQKALSHHDSAKFDIMYASVVPEEIATGRKEALDRIGPTLEGFGGTADELDDPRRRYDLRAQDVIQALPPDIDVVCPTEADRELCETEGDLLGIPLEPEIISFACDGRAAECVMADGMCTQGVASQGLPPTLRQYADYMWQRTPFRLGDPHAAPGLVQSPGTDLAEPFWMGRYYGFLAHGAGQVLAWQGSGSCP